MDKKFLIQREGKEFVLWAGLLDLAHQRGLKAIRTELIQVPTQDNGNVAIVFATVETEQGTFTGIGDAAPNNVNRMMANALIRLAETRSKARALRDAVNVGVTAFEELAENGSGADDEDEAMLDAASLRKSPPVPASRPGYSPASNGHWPGHEGNGDPGPKPVRPAVASTAPTAPSANGANGASVSSSSTGSGAPASPTTRSSAAPPTPSAAPSHAPSPTRGQSASGPPATDKQRETIERMARAAGKSMATEGLSRAQASELISGLIAEMPAR